MLIRRIRAANFRSFDEVDVELARFSVLIGANASGKSNFVGIFQFLKDAVKHGLDNALSMQGGAEYAANVSIGASKNLEVWVHAAAASPETRGLKFSTERDGRWISVRASEFSYGFGVELGRKGFTVADENLVATCDFAVSEDAKADEQRSAQGRVVLTRDHHDIVYDLQGDDLPLAVEDVVAPSFQGMLRAAVSDTELLVETPWLWAAFLPPLSFAMSTFFDGIGVYHFDPRLPKRPAKITGKTELEPDGGNLAIAVKRILSDKAGRDKMYNLFGDLLPIVQGIKITVLPDRSLMASLKETHSGNKFLPAFLMSDGTMNLAALVVALYFEEKSVVIVEEPESNIHPSLVSRVVAMMRDVSENLGKQVMVTTHNPELVRHAGLENLLLIHRDEAGFSRISRPSEKEHVKVFLEHEMEIEDLYVQNLLER